MEQEQVFHSETSGEGMVQPPKLRRRSGVSAFAADGNGNFREYENGRMVDAYGADYDDAMASAQVYRGMEQLGRRAAAVKRHNDNLGNATILSAMKVAQQNGGRVPAYALDYAMRNFGMDGKTRAIGGMGYAQNGDFVIDELSQGPNGSVVRNPRIVKPREQYDMMRAGGGTVFNSQDIAAMRKRLMDNYGYTDAELPAVPTFENVKRGAGLRQSQAAAQNDQKLRIEAVKLLMDAEKRGKPMTVEDFALKMPHGLSNVLFPERYETNEDGSQRMIETDEGMKPVKKPYTPEEVRATLEDFIGRVKNGGSEQGGDNRKDEILSILGLAPRALTPQEQEIQTRQLDNAVEDQRRADIQRNPQQLVHYTDADGNRKVGGGYIVDGKVYDGNGREIVGATPTDRNGNPLQTAQAQPSTQDGQDGGALLRQMRGGRPPAAKGGEQSGPGGAQRAVQSEGSPIPAPNGESETTHNGKRYRWGWNKQQGRWAYNPVKPTRDEALSAEKARRRRNGEQMRKQAGQAGESEPPKLDNPSTTNNSVPVSIGTSLPSRPAFDEEPMLPEERERQEAERERREAELLEQNRRDSIYRRFMDEHGRGPTEDELKAELARLAEIAG